MQDGDLYGGTVRNGQTHVVATAGFAIGVGTDLGRVRGARGIIHAGLEHLTTGLRLSRLGTSRNCGCTDSSSAGAASVRLRR